MIEKFNEAVSASLDCTIVSADAAELANFMVDFQPSAVCYCMSNEDDEIMSSVSKIAGYNTKSNTPLSIIASQPDYDSYVGYGKKQCDLFIPNHLPFESITEIMTFFLGRIAYEKGKMNPQPVAKGGPPAKPKKQILVVDDSPVMLRTIANILKSDYGVATALSAKIAMRYLQTKPADLILLDYEMPTENGPEFFSKLKNNPYTADIPVVFLTGVYDSDKIQTALSMRPTGYILKPIETVPFMKKINEILNPKKR